MPRRTFPGWGIAGIPAGIVVGLVAGTGLGAWFGVPGIGAIIGAAVGVSAGKGLLDLISDADRRAADAVLEKFAVVKERVAAIDPPFDQAIVADENTPPFLKVKAAVQALWALVYALADANEVLQLDVKRS